MQQAKTIDEYIALFPPTTQEILHQLRAFISDLAPDAHETMSYQIPTFKMKENLVHFAAYKNHIGFYPGAKAIEHFQEEIIGYKNAKGSVQFPITKPLPYDLIKRIVLYRLACVKAKG